MRQLTSIDSVITSRRTIRETKSDPIPKDIILEILEKAAYAPFHNKVEPWSVVMATTYEEHVYFLKCVFESYERNQILASYSEDQIKKIKDAYEKAFLHTPVTLIVTTDLFGDEKQDLESIAATSAFIQNIQLLAWKRKIGVVWRTNPYIFDPKFAEAFSIPSNKKIMGTLHLGYFHEQDIPKPKKRRPVSEWVSSIKDHRSIL
jgi:nitroreductase